VPWPRRVVLATEACARGAASAGAKLALRPAAPCWALEFVDGCAHGSLRARHGSAQFIELLQEPDATGHHGTLQGGDPEVRSAGSWLIGVDIGGTFTDIVAVDGSDGTYVTGKVLTTVHPLDGVFNALEAIRTKAEIELTEAEFFVHATTLASNTLIERTGAKVGLMTTAGFRDIIEIGQEDRYDLYDLQIDLPSVLVPRQWRCGILERMTAQGQVHSQLDGQSVLAATQQLRDRDAIAICFLNSYANDEHEKQAAEMVARECPETYFSVSSEVAPIVREYERFIATVINAYVGPRISSYLRDLSESLIRRGFNGRVGIMKSDGGMCSPEEASRYPARILESGPAAGIIAASAVAQRCGEPLSVALDIGGTTAKACLIRDGVPALTEELRVARLHRLVDGSGLPLRLPSLDLIEIGAGGGSIASINNLGLLQVGPSSAGANPGPACYALGGELPTVTDADAVLGYLGAADFAGGDLQLDVARAQHAIEAHILSRTGTRDPIVAAWGIYDVVNENMSRAVRLHCLEHGIDPGAVTLIATGGAGPVHASGIMSRLGAVRVICPVDAGVGSAIGLLLAPRTVDQSVAQIVPLEGLTSEELRRRLLAVERDLRSRHTENGTGMTATCHLNVRVQGQAYDVDLLVAPEAPLDGLASAFRKEYEARFGRPPWPGKLEIVGWSVRLTQAPSAMPRHKRLTTSRPRSATTRRAYFGPRLSWMEAKLLDRASLSPGMTGAGPILIQDEASTIVVGPAHRMSVDPEGNVVIHSVSGAHLHGH